MPSRRAAAVTAASNLAASASSSRSVSGAGAAAKNGNNGPISGNGQPVASSSTSAAAKATTSALAAPSPLVPLSPIIARLRKMWKFAAVCQFLFTFDEAFGMSGFESAALEEDLDGTETRIIPDLMRRMLYTLTLNRNIDETNWEDHMRAQYLRRDPDNALLGTLENPISWHSLPLKMKVESLHTACDWQMWDAERFRRLVKNEEESHVWRIDPIGWDADDNTYWLFDDNRLWVQHPPPPPPVPVKAKAPPKKSSKKAKAEARKEAQNKRKRESSSTAVAQFTPLRTPARTLKQTPSTRSSPRNRTSSGGGDAPVLKRARSSRGRQTDDWEPVPESLLFDGDDDSELSDPPDEEAQDDTMDIDDGKSADPEPAKDDGVDNENKAGGSNDAEAVERRATDFDAKKELEGGKLTSNGRGEANDDESTILTSQGVAVHAEKMEETTTSSAIDAASVVEAEAMKREDDAKAEKTEEDAKDDKKEKEEEWIEFEAIAISQPEWEWISQRFARSKHPDEKALHQLLKQDVVPKVLADLDEAEKQRLHELALANRKRSSRIALKESEKEERERDRIARQRMEEKMTAIRDEEAAHERREREEKDAARTREERQREREERVLAREREVLERAQREIEQRDRRERLRELRKLKREQIIANGGHPPPEDDDDDDDDDSMDTDDKPQGGAKPVEDSWELNCEVCGKRGVNLDDSEELVCCETCGLWQHTDCWNAWDRKVGRPARDWEAVDFFCCRCRPPPLGHPRPAYAPRPANQPQRIVLRTNGQPTAQQAAQKPEAQQVQHDVHKNVSLLGEAQAASTSPAVSAVPVQPAPLAHQYPSAAAYSSTGLQHPSASPFPPYTTIYGGYGAHDQHSHRPGVNSSVARPSPPGRGPSASQSASPPNHDGPLHPYGHAGGQSAAPQSAVPIQPPRAAVLQPLVHGTSVSAAPQAQVLARSPSQTLQPAQLTQTPSQPIVLPQPKSPGTSPVASVSAAPLMRPLGSPSTPSAPNTAGAESQGVQNGKMAAPQSTSTRQAPPVPVAPASPTMVGNGGSVSHASAKPYSPTISPTHGSTIPARSPGSSSSGISSVVPRSIASQASGSFPLRHTPARSPLSGPHHASPNAVPLVALPPPVRTGSPSPMSRPSVSQQQSARPSHLTHDLLHSRQTAAPPLSAGLRVSGTVAPPEQDAARAPSPALSAGSGSATGSLARPSTQNVAPIGPPADPLTSQIGSAAQRPTAPLMPLVGSIPEPPAAAEAPKHIIPSAPVLVSATPTNGQSSASQQQQQQPQQPSQQQQPYSS